MDEMEKKTEETGLSAVAPVQQEVEPEIEPEMTVRFAKPFIFEQRQYMGIDLSGMEDLSAADMISAEKFLSRQGVISPIPEMTAEYVCFIAGRVTGQPMEFFKALPPKEFIKVKNRITSFFYGEE